MLSNMESAGEPGALWDARPFQIVSLWDMYKFRADLFCLIAREVEIWRSNALYRGRLGVKDVDKKGIQDVQEKLNLFLTVCENAGLESAPPHIQRMLRRIEGDYGEYVAATLLSDSEELYQRIQDEMAKILFMRIPKDRQEFYEKPLKGWEAIIERFPGALMDTEEAWKCFALSRYTATVFHSLQVVEVGVIELGTFISVNDPHSNWISVTKRLKQVLGENYKNLDPFLQNNRDFLEQVYGTIEALKNAWRNKVSHIGQRLALMSGEEFHPDIAEEILIATRAFMRRLADGLPPKPDSAS